MTQTETDRWRNGHHALPHDTAISGFVGTSTKGAGLARYAAVMVPLTDADLSCVHVGHARHRNLVTCTGHEKYHDQNQHT